MDGILEKCVVKGDEKNGQKIRAEVVFLNNVKSEGY
jgi:hypothetical protein